ncbi:MAG: zinc-dependent metalloprotease [Sphingobacteriaceae bacterium]|nr:zinc-dependent metalloprotease [Sphingobacteriaceae bacterium]
MKFIRVSFLTFCTSLLFGLLVFSSQNVSAQRFWPFKKHKKTVVKDTLNKKNDLKGLKSYDSIVTKKTITKAGYLTLHQLKNDLYFEIPLQLMGREILVVNKLTKVPDKINDSGLNKGIAFDEMVISFELDTNLKVVFIRKHNPLVQVPPKDRIAKSVSDNFINPIIESLKLQAYSKDKKSILIKVNNLFDGSSVAINKVYDAIGMMTNPNKDLSRIINFKAFSENVLIRSELSAKVTGVPLTVETLCNFVLLPEIPMTPRFEDRRVGFFSTDRWYFNDAQHELETRKVVNRWRLEPKKEDIERYFKGELVEPKKPIVYYIDSSTPKQWVPFIKQGVEDWQKAFESAGFKNAIIVKDIPENDPDFDPDDVRFSTVVYAASDKANAMGPSTIDPRSGEIIEADIIWWHNVMTILRDWIRVQTGAVDAKARGNKLTDEQMGHAIRFVSSHEVGHTLGMKHNMGSSFACAVDSLRSKDYTNKIGGTAPSIMDYARFNYVAQPNDGVEQLTPQIGVYDKYAIDWAYRYTGKQTPQEELSLINEWIRKHENDPNYYYGEQQEVRDCVDPRSQIEDLGDNAVKASLYGLANLKRIVPQIVTWTKADGANYDEAGRLLNAVIGQWYQYAYHVLANVGGIYVTPTVYGHKKDTYVHVPKVLQKEAVNYLIDQVFITPLWLFKADVLKKSYPIKSSPIGAIEYGSLLYAKSLQSFLYFDLLRDERMSRMMENEAANGNKSYKVVDLMNDLYVRIFEKTIQSKNLDIFERNAQKGFVDALIVSIEQSMEKPGSRKIMEQSPIEQFITDKYLCKLEEQPNLVNSDRQARNLLFNQVKRVSDAVSIKKGLMRRILALLKQKTASADTITSYHYQDLTDRIEQYLAVK